MQQPNIRPLCADCSLPVRRVRSRELVISWSLAVLVVGSLTWYLVAYPDAVFDPKLTELFGEREPEVLACSLEDAILIANEHASSGRFAQATARLDLLAADCPHAVSTGLGRVEYHRTRALIAAFQKDHAVAIREFIRALLLGLEPEPAMAMLAAVMSEAGMPCEAVTYAEMAPNLIDAAMFASGCQEPRFAGHVTATVRPATGMLSRPARVSDRDLDAQLATAQPFVIVSESAIKDVALVVDSNEEYEMQLFGPPMRARFVILPTLSLGDAVAHRVPALVVASLPGELEVVVGQSFLARAQLTYDTESGALELAPRPAPDPTDPQQNEGPAREPSPSDEGTRPGRRGLEP